MKDNLSNFEQTKADSPLKYTLTDWWAVIKRTFFASQYDNVTVIAAGVAFFSLLAVFPLISAALSIFSYFANPGNVDGITQTVASLMPGEAYKIIEDQISSVLNADRSSISLGIIISILLAFFAAGAGIRAMMRAMNVAYEEVESRNILTFYLYAALMTLGSLVFVWLSLFVIIGIPTALAFLRLNGIEDVTARVLPWILLIIVFCFACGVMYRFGPSRRPARKRWIYPGIVFAMISWMIMSYGFSKFVQYFGNYNETFGGIASVIILLVWLWLTATVIIVGAQLNSELERQTIVDTTRGPARPLGSRGAVMADFVAKLTRRKDAMIEVSNPEGPEGTDMTVATPPQVPGPTADGTSTTN